MLRIVYILILFNLFPFVIKGQIQVDTLATRNIVIRGRVTDADNLAVSEATVIIGELQTQTAQNGTFEIQNPKLPLLLRVTHSSYEPYQKLITLQSFRTDILYLDIQLENKVTDLEEVEVVATQLSRAYPKNYTHIIDYDFVENRMRMLLKEKNKYFLREVDRDNNTVVEIQVKPHPKNFFHDCQGNTHIVYKDSVFQVDYTQGQMELNFKIDLPQFQKIMEPCVAESDSVFVFRNYVLFNKAIIYYTISKENGLVKHLYKVLNTARVVAGRDYAVRASASPEADEIMGELDGNADYMKALRDIEEDAEFAKKIIAKNLYAPLVCFRDSFLLFDHDIDSAVVFDRGGKWVRNFPITYHHDSDWGEELIVDEECKRIFVKYNRNGTICLRQLNTNDGTLMKEIRLDEHAYASNIRVKGNYVYYIYHHFINDSINYLYKRRID